MQRLCFFQPLLISRLFYISVVLFCFVSFSFFLKLRHFFRYARAYVRTGSYAPVPHSHKHYNYLLTSLRDVRCMLQFKVESKLTHKFIMACFNHRLDLSRRSISGLYFHSVENHPVTLSCPIAAKCFKA